MTPEDAVTAPSPIARSAETTVTIARLPPVDELSARWVERSRATGASFFLSWPWIGTWLATIGSRVRVELLTVADRERTLALGLVVRRRRLGILPASSWTLTATGNPDLDKIWIEYNGLLCDGDVEAEAWAALADWFAKTASTWDEIRLPGVSPAAVATWESPRFMITSQDVKVTRFVDLETIRRSGSAYRDTLRKKTRRHIEHTAEYYAESGEIKVEIATTLDEALRLFEELAELHESRWRHLRHGGAFSNRPFVAFHRRLLRDFFDAGVVQMLRVSAGERTIGILYNLVHRGDVFVYQTGFNYASIGDPNKHSPGLLTHALAIEANCAGGRRRYDFMAGDSQYKRNLSTGSETLCWVVVQRAGLPARAKKFLRDTARRVRARIKGAASTAS